MEPKPMRALRVLTMDFEPRGEIAAHTSLSITRRFYGVGEFELRLPARAAGASGLELDVMLVPVGAPDKTVLVESITLDQRPAELVLRGCTLDGLVRRRLAVPPPASASSYGWDRAAGDAESVFQHYARVNLTEPSDPKRKIPRLVLAENRHRGMAGVAWQARFEPLDALLRDLGEHTGMGFWIRPDFERKELVFDVAEGRRDAALLALSMGNAGSMRRTLDAAALRNTAYVGGQGEDENRLILAVGEGFEGLARRETWVDGGSIELPEELVTAGRRRLRDAPLKNTIQTEVLPRGAFQFGRDFDVGDWVLLETPDGARVSAPMIQARETYSRDRPPQIDAVFGDPVADLAGVIGELKNGAVR